MDRDHGFLFVENVYFNGNDFLCFNIVSIEPINDKNNAKSISIGSNNTDYTNIKIDSRRKRKIKNMHYLVIKNYK